MEEINFSEPYMLDFFAPPAAKPRLAEDKIAAEYRRMRLKVFLGAFLGYAAYYLVTKTSRWQPQE